MTRVLILAAAAGVVAVGCDKPAAEAKEKTWYVCPMGAECGKKELAEGEKVPDCCGTMKKAELHTCPACKAERLLSDLDSRTYIACLMCGCTETTTYATVPGPRTRRRATNA